MHIRHICVSHCADASVTVILVKTGWATSFGVVQLSVADLDFLHESFFFLPQFVKGQITSWPSWGTWKTISPACRECTTTAKWYWVTWRLPTWSITVISPSLRLVVSANMAYFGKGILLHFWVQRIIYLSIKCCSDPRTVIVRDTANHSHNMSVGCRLCSAQLHKIIYFEK